MQPRAKRASRRLSVKSGARCHFSREAKEHGRLTISQRHPSSIACLVQNNRRLPDHLIANVTEIGHDERFWHVNSKHWDMNHDLLWLGIRDNGAISYSFRDFKIFQPQKERRLYYIVLNYTTEEVIRSKPSESRT